MQIGGVNKVIVIAGKGHSREIRTIGECVIVPTEQFGLVGQIVIVAAEVVGHFVGIESVWYAHESLGDGKDEVVSSVRVNFGFKEEFLRPPRNSVEHAGLDFAVTHYKRKQTVLIRRVNAKLAVNDLVGIRKDADTYPHGGVSHYSVGVVAHKRMVLKLKRCLCDGDDY